MEATWANRNCDSELRSPNPNLGTVGRSIRRQLRMARRVKSGQVFINNYGAGGGVELPFGGVKSSGYGREKGFEALYGFTTLKTVAIKHG